MRNITTALIPISIVFNLIDYFCIHKVTEIVSWAETGTSGALVILSILNIDQILKQQPDSSHTHLPMFWINVAILIYHAGTLSISLTTDYLVRVLKDDMINAWIFMISLGILYYLTIAWALSRAQPPHHVAQRSKTFDLPTT